MNNYRDIHGKSIVVPHDIAWKQGEDGAAAYLHGFRDGQRREAARRTTQYPNAILVGGPKDGERLDIAHDTLAVPIMQHLDGQVRWDEGQSLPSSAWEYSVGYYKYLRSERHGFTDPQGPIFIWTGTKG